VPAELRRRDRRRGRPQARRRAILVQAYPDDLDKMAPEVRRDAFCGKFSIMDVFCQYGLKFTALQPTPSAPRARPSRRTWITSTGSAASSAG